MDEDWGWEVVLKYSRKDFRDRYTFKNKKTGKLCKQSFGGINRVVDGWKEVTTEDGLWTYFNPEIDMTFQASCRLQDLSFEYCIRQYPEDFALLTTAQFRDQKKIESYLDAAAEGIKAHCSKKETTEKAEKYANKIKKLIANKIKAEKAKIAEQDKEKAEKDAQQKANVDAATKATDEIKNLGSLLNDDETEV